MSIDQKIFLEINHFAQKTPQLHGFFRLVASYEVVLFAALLLLGYGLARKASDIKAVTKSLWAVLGTLVAVAVNQPLVHLFHENRPFVVLPHILVLARHSQDFGFPSDHTTMASAITAGLFLYNRKLGYIALVLSLLLAFSRVYVAVHWPQDVLAGLVLGAAVSLLGYAILRKPLGDLVTWLAENTLLRIFISKSE